MSNLSRVIDMVQAAISASFFPIYGEVWVWLLQFMNAHTDILSQSYVDPLPSIYIYFYYYGSIDIKSKKKWKRQRCWRNTYDISWTTNYNHKIKMDDYLCHHSTPRVGFLVENPPVVLAPDKLSWQILLICRGS